MAFYQTLGGVPVAIPPISTVMVPLQQYLAPMTIDAATVRQDFLAMLDPKLLFAQALYSNAVFHSNYITTAAVRGSVKTAVANILTASGFVFERNAVLDYVRTHANRDLVVLSNQATRLTGLPATYKLDML